MDFIHNFVISGSFGYSEIGFYDLVSLDNVCFFKSLKDGIDSKFSRIIQRITFSDKINTIFDTPFSNYTFSRLYPFKFTDNKPLVYVFLGQNQTLYQSGYIEYIRKRYPGVKVVLYMIDLISRNRKLQFEKMRTSFDLILSYDAGDCEKYGLEFYPTPYSFYPVPEKSSIDPFDVFYCGNAKMRGKIIIDAYRKCKEKNLKCKFFITDMPSELRIYSDDIIYDHYIDYKENLQYVKKSKCILEVMQEKADGYTPRLWESIMYDRHLLSNNSSLIESSYYNPSSMHNFNDIACINEWIDKPVMFDHETKESLSPLRFLHFIDNKL